MLDRSSHQEFPIGCDIGAGYVRLAQVQPAGGQKQVVLAEAATGIPEPAQDASAYDAITAAVRQLRRVAPFKGRRAVLCVEPARLKYRSVRLAPMPEADLASAARWKVAGEVGVPVERLQCAVIPLGKVTDAGKTRQEVVAVAGEVEMLERLAASVLDGRLEPVAIDASSCAVARALGELTARDDESATATLELHPSTATLSASRGGRVRFLRGIGGGLSRVDQIAAELLDVSPSQVIALRLAADEVERGAAWPFPEITRERSAAAITDAWHMYARELAGQVSLSLQYFCDAFAQSVHAEGFILASAPMDPGFIERLSKQAGVSLAAPDPALVGQEAGGAAAEPPEAAARWLTGMGLSMYDLPAPPVSKGVAA
jgi:Tfp pilus assembly PilM family ATPase